MAHFCCHSELQAVQCDLLGLKLKALKHYHELLCHSSGLVILPGSLLVLSEVSFLMCSAQRARQN